VGRKGLGRRMAVSFDGHSEAVLPFGEEVTRWSGSAGRG
jgi:hypothetical protein